jgi:hypothetical protein
MEKVMLNADGHNHSFLYFPALRWKQGEQIATRKLDDPDRAKMLPLAEIQSLDTTALAKLTKQLTQAQAGIMPIALDLKVAYGNGPVSVPYLANLTAYFQGQGLNAWPVLHATDALLNPAALANLKGQPAVVLRIYPLQLSLASALSALADLRKACGKNTSIFVVLDLYAIADIELLALAGLAEPFVLQIAATTHATQIALIGGSFPYQLGAYKQGVQTRLPRKELTIWKELRKRQGCAAVAFGDYAVTNPLPLEEIDPRNLNPAAAIRYALKNEWWLLRAAGVRTKGKGGMGQYNALCKLLIASADYSGRPFSFGDRRYDDHCAPGATSGSFMTWRRDATSHHLTYTVRQLASGNI